MAGVDLTLGGKPWVLGMGPHCVVRRPGELRERVRGLARGVEEGYEQEGVLSKKDRAIAKV